MVAFTARAETRNASRYLQQLCKHWSHKFDVAFDEHEGRVPFDEDNVCLLAAKPDHIDLALEGKDRESVARLCDVVSEHLKRFAFREDLEIAWKEDEAA